MNASACDSFIADVRQYDGTDHCHSHAHHQIILPVSGALELDIEGESGAVRMLQGAIVPGDFRHTFHGVGDNRFVVVDLPASPPLAEGWSDNLHRFLETPNFFALDPGLYHYVRLVCSEASRSARDQQLSNLLANLLAELLASRGGDAQKPLRPARRLAPALEYVDVHLDGDVSVQKLAALCHFSVGRFHAAFRGFTGRTPVQYITELRMHRASSLLKETGWPIAQIAIAVGYGSQAAFTHAFKRHFGISPSWHRSRADTSVPDASSPLWRNGET